MANELESLLVRLEADTAGLRRALKDAENGVNNYERGVGKSLGRAEAAFSRYQANASKQLQNLAAAAAAYVSVGVAGAAVGDVSRLGALAEQAGMTADAYQALRAAASLAGAQHSEFDAVMKEFAVKVGEARAKTGDLYEFLKFALPTLGEQIRSSKDTSEALGLVINATERLSSAEDKALLSKKAFGNASLELSAFLNQGNAAMAQSAERARELGLVLDKEAIAEARRAREEFDKLSTQLDSNFKKALTAVLPYVNSVAEGLAKLADNTRGVNIDPFNIAATPDFYSAKQLAAAAAQIKKELQAIEDASKEGAAVSNFQRLEQWLTLDKIRADNLRAALEEINGALERQNRLGQFGAGLANARKPATTGDWKTTVERADSLKLRAKPDYAGADALLNLEKQRLTAIQASGQLIKLEYDQELETFRRMLENKTINEAQFQEARGKLNQIMSAKIAEEAERERQKLVDKIQPMMSVIERSLSAPLEDAFNGGVRSAKEYFAELMKGFALALQQALIIKPVIESLTNSVTSGASGNMLSSIFSGIAGARAGGGPVMPGRAYLVGEKGPELIVPQAFGNVIPNHALGGSGAGGMVVNIDARNADVGVVPRIMEAMKKVEQAREPAAVQVAATARRFPTRRG